MRHHRACLIALAAVCDCAAVAAAHEPGTAARAATAGPHVPWIAHKDLPFTVPPSATCSASVQPHDMVMLRVTP